MRQRYRLCAALAALALGLLGTTMSVSGHSGAKGVVAERMELMERYEELMDRMFAVVHGEIPYSADLVTKAASEIRETSGGELANLFPEGSLQEPSEAGPEIWEQFETFSHYADMLQDFAGLLESNPTAPSDPELLPRKWEEVPAMGGMMRGDASRPGGGTPARGMMGGQNAASMEAALWRMAHACNTCHEQFRED